MRDFRLRKRSTTSWPASSRPGARRCWPSSTTTAFATSCAPRRPPSRSLGRLVPEDVKRTFDRLGIPEAERKFLSASRRAVRVEVVYHRDSTRISRSRCVIFTDMDTALREHEDILRRVLRDRHPIPNDNKLAALKTLRCESGGSFVYVARGRPRGDAAPRLTSGSAPRIWGSSGARSSSPSPAHTFATSRVAPALLTTPTHFTRRCGRG